MAQFFSSKDSTKDAGEAMDVFNYCTTKNITWVEKVNDVIKPYMLDILKLTLEFLENLGVQSWVADGTALGVYREGGKMIPHDHDMDLGILEEDYLKVRQNLHLLSPKIRVVGQNCAVSKINWVQDGKDIPWNGFGKKTLKLYHADIKSYALDKQADLEWLSDDCGLPIPPQEDQEKRIPAPRVDLSTYGYSNSEKTHIHLNWAIPDWDQSKHKIPIDSIFPLKKTTFEGLEVNAANDLKTYLESIYGYLGRDCKYDPVTDHYVKLEK